MFEAVVNSIHAIDERIQSRGDLDLNSSYIRIKIIRSGQMDCDETSLGEIVGFEIIDNGIGFTEENFSSFQTLDSEYKISMGGRGVGRLLWLKAFAKVSVTSTYKELNYIRKRSFDFNQKNDIHNAELIDVDPSTKIETIVRIENIKREYQQYLHKTLQSIANAVLEHCLWYFIREGGAPSILLFDSQDSISLNNEYEAYMLSKSKTISFDLKTVQFELTHLKLKNSTQNKHTIIYTANNRLVMEESINGKIAGLFGALKEGDEKFYYLCFVSSRYLDEKVNTERLGFFIPETNNGALIEEEISFSEIRNSLLSQIKEFLYSYLQENKELGLNKVLDYISTKAPRYRPIWDKIDEIDKVFDPNISEKELELKLHSHLVSFESKLIADGHDLMQPQENEDEEDYSKRVEEYLNNANDIKKSDLANYVAHRKVILDLLRKTIRMQKDGKYSREDVIHKLIMPMRKDSNELFADESNLWLLDERLAFHNYLASDKTIKSMPITECESAKEPDIVSLNVYENPLLVNEGQNLPLASITVVELKRPMRDDAIEGEDKNPIEQALNYLKRIRNGKVQTATGRLIPNSESIPGFCYIISDITDSIRSRCEYLDLSITSDKLGYFGYHKKFNAYIEVISFDRLLNMAQERNRVFFDKLGLPTN